MPKPMSAPKASFSSAADGAASRASTADRHLAKAGSVSQSSRFLASVGSEVGQIRRGVGRADRVPWVSKELSRGFSAVRWQGQTSVRLSITT